jgi:hypothetical protein
MVSSVEMTSRDTLRVDVRANQYVGFLSQLKRIATPSAFSGVNFCFFSSRQTPRIHDPLDVADALLLGRAPVVGISVSRITMVVGQSGHVSVIAGASVVGSKLVV